MSEPRANGSILRLDEVDTYYDAIRALKAKYAQDPGYDFHTYAEDKNLRRFAEAMVTSWHR